MKENRHISRLPLKVPVIFRWRDRQGTRCRGNGFTRDLSSEGMFVVSDRCPPAGAAIKLNLILPALSREALGLRMAGQGRVLRVDATGGAPTGGFAARNESFRLWEFEFG